MDKQQFLRNEMQYLLQNLEHVSKFDVERHDLKMV